MRIELFHAPGCAHCAASEARLKEAAKQAVAEVDWRNVNVLDELDHAVEIGVLALPAIAIDGELTFASLPTPRQLRNALIRRTKRTSRDGS